MMLKINEVNKRSGNLKNLNLAIQDSKTATNMLNIRIFMANKNRAIRMSASPAVRAIPHGKNKFDPNDRKIRNLFADAHSISANLFPEYSRIIASWIIVSSR